jgi:hypothetical protein
MGWRSRERISIVMNLLGSWVEDVGCSANKGEGASRLKCEIGRT